MQNPWKTQTSKQKFQNLYTTLLTTWPEHEHKIATTPKGETHVITCGPIDAPPLVLLHGRNTPSISWTWVINDLAKTYRIYAIDTIGEPGRSVSNGTPVRSADDYVQWLAAVLGELDLSAAHLCAHSFSGWYATHFALQHPEQVKSLTLIEPAQVFAQFSVRWILHCLPPYFWPSDKTIRPFFEWTAQGHPIDPIFLDLVVLGMTDFQANKEEAALIPDKLLKNLTVPTLQLLAEQSVVHNVQKAVKRAERLTPHVASKIIADSSHFIQIDQPDVTVQMIRQFIKSE